MIFCAERIRELGYHELIDSRQESILGLDKNVRGNAQEIQAVWWFKLLRPVWHLNEGHRGRPARSFDLCHVFLSDVPLETGYAMPPKGPERDALHLPDFLQAQLDKDDGIDGVAIYEEIDLEHDAPADGNSIQKRRLYVIMQSKSAIEAPWSKPAWARPDKFLKSGQALLRRLKDDLGAECVLLWYSNFGEFTALKVNIENEYLDLS